MVCYALIAAALAGLIRPQVADVNMVSAPIMVKERGIILSEVKRDKSGVFDGYIKLTVKTEHMTRSIAGHHWARCESPRRTTVRGESRTPYAHSAPCVSSVPR